MALKFKCRECGEYIIAKFLKVGEVAKCRNCGAENVVPENALKTDEEPKDIIPIGTKPEMVEKAKGKVRPFESVLILSIITLSIYFWVYLFKTLGEMKKAFTFDAHETNPNKVRPILIAHLIVSVLVAISWEASGWSLGTFAQPYKTTGSYAWLVISNIIDMTIFVVFWSSFVKLIEVCQNKGGMVPLNRSPFWIVIGVNVVISFADIGVTSSPYLVLTGGLELLAWGVLLYLTVKQVNRTWTESGKVGIS